MGTSALTKESLLHFLSHDDDRLINCETGGTVIRTADKGKVAYSRKIFDISRREQKTFSPTYSAAPVPCLERPKVSASQTTLATRSTEYPFLPPRIYNPSTMSTSCAPEVTNHTYNFNHFKLGKSENYHFCLDGRDEDDSEARQRVAAPAHLREGTTDATS